MRHLEKLIMAKGRHGPKVGVLAFVYSEEEGIRYVWITASNTKRWGGIKGTVEEDETHEQTVKAEAKEEAGLKIKSTRLVDYVMTNPPVAVYAVEVKKMLDTWKESHERDRTVLSFKESMQLLSKHRKRNAWALKTLPKLHKQLKRQRKFRATPLAPPKKKKKKGQK